MIQEDLGKLCELYTIPNEWLKSHLAIMEEQEKKGLPNDPADPNNKPDQ